VQQGDDHDPDLALLQAAAAGDGAACRGLVDRHLRSLHAFAARLLDDASEAEDVCQDAFVKLWQRAPDWIPDRARVVTWLYQVALNGCRDRLRRRRPETAFEPERMHSEQPGPGSQHERDERHLQLHQAIARLPERQREALLLFHLQGHSQSEVAAVLEVSIDALESLLARARRTLRAQLDEPAGEGARVPSADEE
jgi:RNA polymerase sigma-70 factor, ECF subfamily